MLCNYEEEVNFVAFTFQNRVHHATYLSEVSSQHRHSVEDLVNWLSLLLDYRAHWLWDTLYMYVPAFKIMNRVSMFYS